MHFPTVTPPEFPKFNLFGNAAVEAWLDMPGVELAIEATFIHGVDVKSVSPDYRLLPLSINLDKDGRRTAQVGRQHQSEWFESRLHPSNIYCISRSAFEITWSDHSDLSSGSVFALQTLGSGIVQVNGVQVLQGSFSPLLPFARITLGSQSGADVIPLVTFTVHLKIGANASSTASIPQQSKPVARPLPGTWWLMCTKANGISNEDIKSFPPQLAGIVARSAAGTDHTLVGRMQQPEVFEALLRGCPELCQFVSRNHLRLEPTIFEDDGCCRQRLRLTNLSQNPVLIDETNPLQHDQTVLLRDGQTVGFTAHGNSPFVTFCLVAPDGVDAGSAKLFALPDVSKQEDRAPEPSVISAPASKEAWQCESAAAEHGAGLLQDCSAALLDISGDSCHGDIASPQKTGSLEMSTAEKDDANNIGSLGPPPARMPKQPKGGCNSSTEIARPSKKGGS
jgi:hypothetical protein